MLAAEQGGAPAALEAELLQRTSRDGAIGPGYVLAFTDADFKVIAASPQGGFLEGTSLPALISGGQPLFMFGERAGIMDVQHRRARTGIAAVELTRARDGAAAVLVPQNAVFADWRKTVSLNVTLFVLTLGILIVILYAYFSQAARAQAADRIYLEAHQRIDLALVRGRCGLWDWDMVRGKMYWSRSMYDMLGYEPCDSMLSFGEVAEHHPRRGRRPVRPRQQDRRRARSTTSTRCSACAMPTAIGCGCAPVPRSSTPRRPRSS